MESKTRKNLKIPVFQLPCKYGKVQRDKRHRPAGLNRMWRTWDTNPLEETYLPPNGIQNNFREMIECRLLEYLLFIPRASQQVSLRSVNYLIEAKYMDSNTLELEQKSRQPFFCGHSWPLSSERINTVVLTFPFAKCMYLEYVYTPWKGRWSSGFIPILLDIKPVSLMVSKPIFLSVPETWEHLTNLSFEKSTPSVIFWESLLRTWDISEKYLAPWSTGKNTI